MKYTIYSYFRSSASFRVRIGMNLKKLDFDYRPVPLLEEKQNSAEYRKLNPMGEVPCLIVDGKALSQSMAILLYLDAVHPTPRLFPEDPFQRSRVIQACEIVNSGMQPLQNLKVLNELEKQFKADSQARQQWAQNWINRGLTGLEGTLARSAGKYSFGDEISAADIYLVPQVFTAKRFNVDLSQYPLISKINENCMRLDPFERAAPDRQPDTPKS